MTLLSTTLALFGLWGCNDSDLIPLDKIPEYSVIYGDTIRIRNDNTVIFNKEEKRNLIFGRESTVFGDTIVLHKGISRKYPSKAPDLSNIKKKSLPELGGLPFRMISVGGGITAGFRDGGYFNEGIETSYPNLIAQQMKLGSFEQPKFSNMDFNGIGRKIKTNENFSGGPVPKFKGVVNNTGVETIEFTSGAFGKGEVLNAKFKKALNIERLDNWAVPNFNSSFLNPSSIVSSYDWDRDIKTNQAFIERLTKHKDEKFAEKILDNKFDLLIYEIGFDDLLNELLKNRYLKGASSLPDPEVKEHFFRDYDQLQSDNLINSQTKFLRNLYDKGLKNICFLNIPAIDKLPYFNLIDQEEIRGAAELAQTSLLFFEKDPYGASGSFEFDGSSLAIPTSGIDSLLSNKVNMALKRGLSEERPLSFNSHTKRNFVTKHLEDFNSQVAAFAELFNSPLVDVNNLYERILKGNYITADGVIVDPSWPEGNFFSSDGIYPSAFGQAIIANEVLRKINEHYGLNIELVSTREMLAN